MRRCSLCVVGSVVVIARTITTSMFVIWRVGGSSGRSSTSTMKRRGNSSITTYLQSFLECVDTINPVRGDNAL